MAYFLTLSRCKVQTIIIHIESHNVVEKYIWSVSKNNSVIGLSEREEIYNKTSVRTGDLTEKEPCTYRTQITFISSEIITAIN